MSSIDETDERVLDNEQGMELYHQLFHDPSYPHGDARYYGFGAVVVGFHSALEAYVRGLGGNLRRAPIHKAVRGLMKESGQTFDPDLDDTLADLEETRHLLVHTRGVVDNSYVRGVRGTTLIQGELRPLEQPEVERFANAVWATAKLLRDRPTLSE